MTGSSSLSGMSTSSMTVVNGNLNNLIYFLILIVSVQGSEVGPGLPAHHHQRDQAPVSLPGGGQGQEEEEVWGQEEERVLEIDSYWNKLIFCVYLLYFFHNLYY